MDSDRWLGIALSQLWSLPYFIGYFVGIVLALCFWGRHPLVSLFAFLGFGILLGNLLSGIGLNVWLMTAQDSLSVVGRSRVLTIAGIIRSVFAMIGYALLIMAIFGWRRTPNTK